MDTINNEFSKYLMYDENNQNTTIAVAMRQEEYKADQ